MPKALTRQLRDLVSNSCCYLNQKNQIFIESLNITTIELQEEWTENELVEFEGVGTRLINEILRWHKDAAKHLRTVYTGTSRMTTWRQKKKE
ncbi:15819_t:CDS:2 [Cetraspora pellucida]|uniref:15819_t:CDS:1 n=1 Tax=Cetraspora pellucida TaxID=1433469 RepID=A0A9N9FIC5_9GLOM|nr:15819_t:CDS:2 [Cetraspora pellucida]